MNEGVDIAPVVILDKKKKKCVRGKPYVPLDLVGGMYPTTCKAVARSEQDPSILTEGHPSSLLPPPLRETLGLSPACPAHLESSRPFCHNSALEKSA